MKPIKMADGRWVLELPNGPLILSGHQLDALAASLSFRLRNLGLELTGAGIEMRVSDQNLVHLCYSSDVPDIIARLAELAPNEVPHGVVG